jgi:DNA-binding MarR family transcriptional regulator
MKPMSHDVEEMVSALMTVVNGIERAKREGKAATLTLLYALAPHQRVHPSELSVELGVHQSSVTRQVQVLEAAGYVDVVADPEDGRSCFLSVTDAGREEIRRLTEVGLARFSAFVAEWDAEEVRTLARLLSKLSASTAAVNQREPRPDGRRWQQRERS